MILADTSILIDFIKGTNPEINALFEKEIIATCGVVLAELLHGIISDKEKEKILDAIDELQWINIDKNIWNEVGINLNRIKKKGLTIPFQDAVIATLCIYNDLQLLSYDRHFEKIAKILSRLRLYKL